jgi:ferrous iron transport protein A
VDSAKDIDKHSHLIQDAFLPETLDQLPAHVLASVTSADWDCLDVREVRRLRELGLDIGAQVEPLNKGGLFGRDPIAVRVGRMTIAMRRAHAAVFQVERV